MTGDTTTGARPARIGGLAGRVRAALTRLSDRAHAAGDARARAAGWTVTTVPGPLGLAGRGYRHPAFGPGIAGRRSEQGREAERRPRHPRPGGEALPVAALPGPRGRKDAAGA